MLSSGKKAGLEYQSAISRASFLLSFLRARTDTYPQGRLGLCVSFSIYN
jgi:hypothetical protein